MRRENEGVGERVAGAGVEAVALWGARQGYGLVFADEVGWRRANRRRLSVLSVCRCR